MFLIHLPKFDTKPGIHQQKSDYPSSVNDQAQVLNSAMDTICLHCGDTGFSNALVFCVICLKVAVHRYCLDEVTYDEFVHWTCGDCEVAVPNEDVGDNLEVTVDRFSLEGWQKNIPRRRRSKRVIVPSRRLAEFIFSPLSNSASSMNTNHDVENNLAAPVELRRSERMTILSRRLADFTFSPSDLSVAGSQGLVDYQHKKRGLFSSIEKSDVM